MSRQKETLCYKFNQPISCNKILLNFASPYVFLPVAYITASIFMRRAPSTTAYPINVLITFATMLSKINTGPKHTSDVRVSFVEAFLNDRIDKGTTMKQHSLVRLR